MTGRPAGRIKGGDGSFEFFADASGGDGQSAESEPASLDQQYLELTNDVATDQESGSDDTHVLSIRTMPASSSIPRRKANSRTTPTAVPETSSDTVAAGNWSSSTPQLPDYQQVVDDLSADGMEGRQVDVVVLESDRDGIEQISETLAGFAELDVVHIVSAGTDGSLRLGNTDLSADTLDAYAGAITTWGDALGGDASVLLHGFDQTGERTRPDARRSDQRALRCQRCRHNGRCEPGHPEWRHGRQVDPESAAPAVTSPDDADLAADYLALPLSFEQNLGQTDDQVDFLARGSGYTVFLTEGDAVLSLRWDRSRPCGATRPDRCQPGTVCGRIRSAFRHEQLPDR